MSKNDNYEDFGTAVDVIKVASVCIDYAMEAKERDPSLDLPSLEIISIAQATLKVVAAVGEELLSEKGEDVGFMDFYNMLKELDGGD